MALAATDIGDNTGSGVGSLTRASVALLTGDLLVVVVNIMDPFDSATVSGVTWNGNAMTQAVAKKGASGGAQWCASSIWYLKIASGTTGDIVATFTDTATDCQMTSRSYTGHDTTTPIGDTDSTDSNSVAAPDLTLTTASGDQVIDGKAAENYGADETAGAGQTALYDAGSFGVSYEDAAGATVNMSWSDTTNAGWVYCAAAVKVAAGGANAVPVLYHMQRMRNL